MNQISVYLNVDDCTVIALSTGGTASTSGGRLERAYEAFVAALAAVTEPDPQPTEQTAQGVSHDTE
jgi:hypothetical protein